VLFYSIDLDPGQDLDCYQMINLLRPGLKHRIPPYPGTNPEPGRLLTQIAQKIFSEPGKYMETRIERRLSSYSQK